MKQLLSGAPDRHSVFRAAHRFRVSPGCSGAWVATVFRPQNAGRQNTKEIPSNMAVCDSGIIHKATWNFVGMKFNAVSLKHVGILRLTGSPNFPQDLATQTPFRNLPNFRHGSSPLQEFQREWMKKLDKWWSDKWLWIRRYLGKCMSIHFTGPQASIPPHVSPCLFG